MRLRYVSLALLISLGVCLRPVQADSPNAPVTTFQLGGTSPATAAAAGKIEGALDNFEAFHVEYLVPDSSGRHPDPIRVTGDLQKPNKMNLRLLRKTALLGQIVSDGVNVTIYNKPTNEYITCRAPLSGDISMIGWQVVNENYIPSDWNIINVLFSPASRQVSSILGTQYLLHSTLPAEFLLKAVPISSLFRRSISDLGSSQFKLDQPPSLPAQQNEKQLKNSDDDAKVSLPRLEHIKVKPHEGDFPATMFTWIPPLGASTPSERPFNHKGHDYTEPSVRLIKPIE